MKQPVFYFFYLNKNLILIIFDPENNQNLFTRKLYMRDGSKG